MSTSVVAADHAARAIGEDGLPVHLVVVGRVLGLTVPGKGWYRRFSETGRSALQRTNARRSSSQRLTPPSAAVFRHSSPTYSGGRSIQGRVAVELQLEIGDRAPHAVVELLARIADVVQHGARPTSGRRAGPAASRAPSRWRGSLPLRIRSTGATVDHGQADGTAQSRTHFRHDLATARRSPTAARQKNGGQRIAPEALDEGLQLGHGRRRQRTSQSARGRAGSRAGDRIGVRGALGQRVFTATSLRRPGCRRPARSVTRSRSARGPWRAAPRSSWWPVPFTPRSTRFHEPPRSSLR